MEAVIKTGMLITLCITEKPVIAGEAGMRIVAQARATATARAEPYPVGIVGTF